MNTLTYLLISMGFLFIGINMVANNRFNQFIIHNLFFASSSSSALVRILGLAVLASFVLFLLNLSYYAILTMVGVVLVFTFFSIQGRSKAKSIAEKKRKDLELMHKLQVDEKKKEITKSKRHKDKEAESDRSKPQSVKQMKEKIWNDGSMSNRDLIRDFNKD